MAQAGRCGDGTGGGQALAQQRAHLGKQILRRNNGARTGVAHVVAQFLAQVHRVDGHHHRIGAQDGIEADDELRAVLHVEQHAVALAHTAHLLQVGGEALGFVL